MAPYLQQVDSLDTTKILVTHENIQRTETSEVGAILKARKKAKFYKYAQDYCQNLINFTVPKIPEEIGTRLKNYFFRN